MSGDGVETGRGSGRVSSLLPQAERPMLMRQRLLDLLRSRWFSRVTVVVAPAGYGKTTLLIQAIDANVSTSMGLDCWVPWNTAGNAGARGSLSAASILGAALYKAVGAQAPAQGNGGVGGIDEVVATVSEAVWCRSPEHVALVLDDVHDVVPESDAAVLLGALVSALPANGHLVLAGRVPPPVPLARLEVEGHVARLDEADLAFDDDELAEFAALRDVPPARLAASGGWPALAELSASARADVTRSAGEYLGQEVLAPLSPTRRRHLALLAHLGPCDGELARAALDAPV